MASLYWIEDALAGILPTLWMTVGLGAPWALALLPVQRWHSRAMAAAVALALGPAWMTAWMFILGLVGAQLNLRLFTPEWILAGSAAMAAGGGFIAWRKRHRFVPKSARRMPLAVDEKLLIAMIAAAVILRWIHTAFWTFTAYDALWVYGFQGRLYFLEGFIPNSIDYYPPFVQLQYAYVQVCIGEINDHAARMVIPMMHIGSILAAYLLGEGLMNRRAGLFTAALWSLHPLVGQWAFRGDLEIPLAFSFTLAAAFFLRAWLGKDRQDALLAGIMLGIAMFTKPTAGAFVWGVLLLFVLELLRTRLRARQWMPRFMVVFWTGLASIPLGSVWYLRNLLLGHEAITLPPEFWLSQARRSGDYLNWIVLAVMVGFLVYSSRRRIPAKRFVLGLIGIALLLAGVLASNPSLFPGRFDPPASYIRPLEAICIALGLCLIGLSLRSALDWRANPAKSQTLGLILWPFLLALPYFATWFYSYSYHYRLGFAIVPLLVLPTAIALSKGLSLKRIRGWLPIQRSGYYGILLLLGMPGIAAAAVDGSWSSVWLLQESLDSRDKKYQAFNPSLIEMVFGLRDYMAESDQPPVVLAPGEERLPFFFPQMQIIDQLAQRLDEYEALAATHFIYGEKARTAYEQAGIDPEQTQLVSALGRQDLFTKAKEHYDGTFSYELYQSRDMSARRRPPARNRFPTLHDTVQIVFGDALRLRAEGLYPPHIFKDTPITLQTAWQAIQPLDSDYRFVLQLFNRGASQVGHQWVLQPAPHRHGYYSTALWEAGETVRELAVVRLPETSTIPRGSNYVMRLGVYDPLRDDYLPAAVDGRPVGDFLTLEGSFQVGRP